MADNENTGAVLVVRSRGWPFLGTLEFYKAESPHMLDLLWTSKLKECGGITAEFDRIVELAVGAGLIRAIIDLEGVHEIFEPLLRVHFILAKKLEEKGGRVLYSGPTDRVHYILYRCNVLEHFRVVSTLQDGFDQLQSD